MYTIVLTLQFASFAITSESRKMGMVFRFTNSIYSYIWATFFLIMSTKNFIFSRATETSRLRVRERERRKKILERVKVLVQVKVYYYTQMELEYEFQPEIRRFFTWNAFMKNLLKLWTLTMCILFCVEHRLQILAHKSISLGFGVKTHWQMQSE